MLLLVVVAILIACPYVMSACVCTEHMWPMNGAAWREQLPDQTIPHILLPVSPHSATPFLLSFFLSFALFWLPPPFRFHHHPSEFHLECSNRVGIRIQLRRFQSVGNIEIDPGQSAGEIDWLFLFSSILPLKLN